MSANNDAIELRRTFGHTVKPPLKVLLLEDSEDDALLLISELHRGGLETSFERVWTAAQMKDALRSPWDIIISDCAMPEFDGLTALSLLKESGLDIPFIMVSGTPGEELAVEAMRRGASDYLLKDPLSRLGLAVARALKEKETREERKTEETLRNSEERFAAFMDHLPAFAWIKDEAGRYVYVNRLCREQFLAGTDPIGKSLRPTGTATHFLENDQAVWNSQTTLETIEQFTFAGRPRQALVRKFPIKDKSGTTILTGGIGIDITELRESGQWFR